MNEVKHELAIPLADKNWRMVGKEKNSNPGNRGYESTTPLEIYTLRGVFPFICRFFLRNSYSQGFCMNDFEAEREYPDDDTYLYRIPTERLILDGSYSPTITLAEKDGVAELTITPSLFSLHITLLSPIAIGAKVSAVLDYVDIAESPRQLETDFFEQEKAVGYRDPQKFHSYSQEWSTSSDMPEVKSYSRVSFTRPEVLTERQAFIRFRSSHALKVRESVK